ncbi:hypothetical protein M8C21_015236 [Ambrosia artemisiifolia]|uniref:Uncharacterized protein n=1 Tax=Ambrosia artemisiifolia TaxID=4212 RepID=A0AAD5G8U6_AMBAR|nr:hypothetical protein M8C21_015236 [Ambrosia artemisiifolia]
MHVKSPPPFPGLFVSIQRVGRISPVMKTAVPIDGRFEHMVLSCHVLSDHSIALMEPEFSNALDFLNCLNLGSYNFLGFAAADEYCTSRVTETIQRYSASMQYSCRRSTITLHVELEQVVADFGGKPAAMVTGMGYVTNSAILPVLVKHIEKSMLI